MKKIFIFTGFHHQTEKQHIQFDMQNYLAKYPIIPALSKMLADFELEKIVSIENVYVKIAIKRSVNLKNATKTSDM